MTTVDIALQKAVKEGTRVGYSIDGDSVTLLKYDYNGECLEWPLLVNETRQWRCWITLNDLHVHKSSGLKAKTQKDLKPKTPKANSSLEDVILSAHKDWVKYQEKGYEPYTE